MRIFLRLYLLLVLPLVLLAVSPVNPISMLGNWWWEKIAENEYGAIYHLVMEDLQGLPQEQWQQKVEDISTHFAYPLTLQKASESKLQASVLKRLKKQGYALSINNPDTRLIHVVEGSDFFLFTGMEDEETDLQMFEKETRGYRYFLNKIAEDNDNPEKEFERIKPFFGIELTLIKASDFQKSNPDAMTYLLKHGLQGRGRLIQKPSYILSNNKQYVVAITPSANLTTIRKYYKYLSTLLPAVLLGIGALFWLFLFRKELNTLKKASVALGKGELQTRTHLSKNSTLHELSSSFNHMAERIQQLLDDHKDLTNAVSHELKTPISRLRFALEMQQESTNEADTAHYTKKIESNIQALQDLIDELLGYTRMQREQHLDKQPQNINDWIQHEVSIFSDYHPDIDFQIDHHVDETVSFDRLQMTRVLNNLLDNAVKHTRSIIKVSAAIQSDQFMLSVEDNGTGISAKDCDSIFEPFTRLDKSRQRSKGGYGLGLAIVKSIVKLHKGQVECLPSALGGASFVVHLPKK